MLKEWCRICRNRKQRPQEKIELREYQKWIHIQWKGDHKSRVASMSIGMDGGGTYSTRVQDGRRSDKQDCEKGAKVDNSTLVGGVRGGHDDRVSPAVLLRGTAPFPFGRSSVRRLPRERWTLRRVTVYNLRVQRRRRVRVRILAILPESLRRRVYVVEGTPLRRRLERLPWRI